MTVQTKALARLEKFEAATKPYTLSAERDDLGGDPIVHKTWKVASKDEALAIIRKLSDTDKWPESYEAILTENATGKRWMYTDDWDPV